MRFTDDENTVVLWSARRTTRGRTNSIQYFIFTELHGLIVIWMGREGMMYWDELAGDVLAVSVGELTADGDTDDHS